MFENLSGRALRQVKTAMMSFPTSNGKLALRKRIALFRKSVLISDLCLQADSAKEHNFREFLFAVECRFFVVSDVRVKSIGKNRKIVCQNYPNLV